MWCFKCNRFVHCTRIECWYYYKPLALCYGFSLCTIGTIEFFVRLVSFVKRQHLANANYHVFCNELFVCSNLTRVCVISNPVTCLLLWLRLYYCYNKYNAKCNMRIVLCRACVPLPNWRTKIDCHKDSINLPLLFIRVSLYVYFVSSRCHSLFIHNSYWLLSSLD